MDNCLYIITGPTAVGKTALCLKVAQEMNAEVISCDSMQMYRGMDIGTAKATSGELEQVPHHCLDILDVSEAGNVQRYQELAQQAVEDILGRGKKVLVTGGSGFYLKSFIEPVVDNIQVSPDVRTQVDSLFVDNGLEAVVEKLLELNPSGVGEMDLQNPRRVTRALERCLSSGLTVIELTDKMEQLPKPFPGLQKKVCVLTRPDDQLKSRILERTSLMLESGLVDEVDGLLHLGLGENPVANAAIGYREAIAFIRGEISTKEELGETISQNTWKLVRKQKKWFRTQLPNANTVDLNQSEDPDLGDLFRSSD